MIELVMIMGSEPLRFVHLFVLFQDSAIRRSENSISADIMILRKLHKYPSLHCFGIGVLARDNDLLSRNVLYGVSPRLYR